MQTTTATYVINVTTEDENVITFYKTMPTKPKTSKGRKSQNDKLCKWVEKEYRLYLILLHTICVNSSSFQMNYTLKELQQRVNKLIELQGENAHCAAWIYTKEDCHLKDENGDIDYDNVVEDPATLVRIFDDVGNIDYIYQVIQECVDEVTEEQIMNEQPELI